MIKKRMTLNSDEVSCRLIIFQNDQLRAIRNKMGGSEGCQNHHEVKIVRMFVVLSQIAILEKNPRRLNEG